MWKKISKNKAKELLKNGKNVFMMPCKMNPDGLYLKPCLLNNDVDFESQVNSCMYYNCNAETGKTLSFYILE